MNSTGRLVRVPVGCAGSRLASRTGGRATMWRRVRLKKKTRARPSLKTPNLERFQPLLALSDCCLFDGVTAAGSGYCKTLLG